MCLHLCVYIPKGTANKNILSKDSMSNETLNKKGELLGSILIINEKNHP